jgi:hypothetical protein
MYEMEKDFKNNFIISVCMFDLDIRMDIVLGWV